MASVMMRVAWLCTLLTRSKLDLAVVPHADYTSIQSLESHSICSPCRACQLLHEGKSHLGSGFSFFGLLFPGQPLVKSHPQLGGVVLSKQSLAVDMQGGLLFLCSKAEDGVGGLPGIDSYKPPFCPTFPRCSAPAVDYSLPLKGVPPSTRGPDHRRIWLPGLYEACL